jgi:EAL and modified HD-GYP domain-containing signal transduction protein
MELYVARQPIFDCRLRVVAYELLFRSGRNGSFDSADGSAATCKVIDSIFYSPEGEGVMGGKPAFINFPEDLLLTDGAAILPPAATVIEILETVRPDSELVAACARLRARGYRIALDDFDPAVSNPLTEVADIIKIDFRATSRAEQAAAASYYGRRSGMLAEKVETQEEFHQAVSMGYQYFQGYFFARPVIASTRVIPGFKLNYMRILQKIRAPELDMAGLAGLITREPALSYKLLRFVNSALFSPSYPIGSVKQALAYAGENEIRRWLSIITLVDLASDKPDELVIGALLRARFCELLAPGAGLKNRAGDLFVLGMFSLLDAILNCPMEELVGRLALPDDIQSALLGKAAPGSAIGSLWRLVLAYESGDWEPVERSVSQLGVPASLPPAMYQAAIQWTGAVFRN